MGDFTAIVIDDENAGRENIKDLVQLYCPELSIVNEAADIETAVEIIKKEKLIDIIFLDINLGPFSGFDVLDAAGQINAAVVFVTAYDQYAVKAFKYAAADYLLKPIVSSELISAVQKIKLRKEIFSINQLAQMKESLAYTRNEVPRSHLYISTKSGALVVKIADLLYIRGEGSYSRLVMLNGEEIIASRLMKTFEKDLAQLRNFIRVHKSYIANMNFLQTIISKNGGAITFSNNVTIPANHLQLVKDYVEGKI